MTEPTPRDIALAIDAVRRGVPIGMVSACTCFQDDTQPPECFGVCMDAVKFIAATIAAERERCAKIAEAHKGSYAKRPRYKETLRGASGEALASIRDEERGEDIAAEIIAREIRKMQ